MNNPLLRAAFESAAPVTDEFDREAYLELVDDLRDGSIENTPDDVVVEEAQLVQDVEVVDELVERAKGIDDADTVTMEALGIALEAITGKYGIKGTRTSMESLSGEDRKTAFFVGAESFKASLEAALSVSQESWAVKDLWDAAGAIERNATELESAVRQLEGKKQWFSEHGTKINSLGQLVYLTVNEQMTKNVAKDTETTLKHAEAVLDIAEQAVDTTAKIRDLVRATTVDDDEEALSLLKKVVALKNPSMTAKQKLDGVFLLGNRHAEFVITAVKNKQDLAIGDWEKVGVYTESTLGRSDHGIRASRLVRIPAWLLTQGVVAKAAFAVSGAAMGSFAIGVGAAFTATTAINNRKAGQLIRHNIKFEEIHASLKKASQQARRSASARRSMPGQFERMFTLRDEVKSLINEKSGGLSVEGRAAMQAIKTIYSSAEKLSWALNMWGFRLTRDVVTHSNAIARKLIAASR